MIAAPWKCPDCGGDGWHFALCPAVRRWLPDPRDAEITALRAALGQERADNERLRAFAQWALDRIPDAVCDEMHRHGLIGINGDPTALLSGRGEGGNDA